ncbi:AEC family transporter [Roseococcus pinisoli]|uniref:AEC family transporter n=1 Tax=Roseococcus pinisoli TaxID=2835040 RepID=A0ABS5QI03_9PROT|nr:AEC family transporter [Roseococcus pinisoli]MBS7813197.1 AEC family transporter [Roseococcus pinisoli]
MTGAALVVLQVVAPIFAIILAGYLAASRKWIDAAGFRGLNSFAFSLAAPSLLFASGTAGHQGGGSAALAFFLGAAVLYVVTLIGSRQARMPLATGGILALNVTFGNTVMMGIPLIAAGFGPEGLSVLISILALHSVLLLGTATIVAEIAQNEKAEPLRLLLATASGVVRNPVVMAVLAAIIWSALKLPVPAPARTTLEMLGAAAPPVALFCLGGSLNGFDARAGWKQTGVTVVLKLAGLPLIVWLVGRAMELTPIEMAVAVTAAALPTGANAFLLARRYAAGTDTSGAAVLISTLLSIVSLSVLLAYFTGVR